MGEKLLSRTGAGDLSLSLQTVLPHRISSPRGVRALSGRARHAPASAMASGGGGRRRAKTRARARGKAKKTKYLSLSDLIIKVEAGTPPAPAPGDEREAEPAPQQWEEAEVKQEEGGLDGGAAQQQQQMEPFALQHEAASTLFAALPAPSLSDILGGGAEDDGGSPSPSPSPSASPSGLPGGAEEEEGLALARRALRGRERWVYCSAGSSPAATTATATTNNSTSSSSPCSSAASTGASARSLLLKLDYEDILAAWADRGPLFIGGGADAPEPQEIDAVLVEVEPSERAAAARGATEAVVAAPTRPGRAERVRRYKEKRRNRLFAKRIRYEVRRVNAVKRPRFKGRFIREHEESELQPT
ncbi:hypothetical protein U9M48_041115 [Paspalum notatum var. saurae]|uniref:CCT domain-containing protein n=1 Tax=Paspalum notatum var. saurae TaxID=547442 RepID=A0AAQ3UTT0_PASNO